MLWNDNKTFINAAHARFAFLVCCCCCCAHRNMYYIMQTTTMTWMDGARASCCRGGPAARSKHAARGFNMADTRGHGRGGSSANRFAMRGRWVRRYSDDPTHTQHTHTEGPTERSGGRRDLARRLRNWATPPEKTGRDGMRMHVRDGDELTCVRLCVICYVCLRCMLRHNGNT